MKIEVQMHVSNDPSPEDIERELAIERAKKLKERIMARKQNTERRKGSVM